MASKKDETAGTEKSWLDEFRTVTEDEFKKLYPLTHALMRAWDRAVEPVLRVVSTDAGLRRGDLAHPATPVLHDLKTLHPAKIEQILAEPALITELVEKPDEPVPADDAKSAQG
ncbi:hypothetical protein [Rhizobium paknamense]|uniref:Uncharacterized protein n=1 Tax=Rhizobium paknamense TaxID=1206817 RepID=A0ABU0I8T8_9HYPH|nr:hypothetical protein [Rhizobium paknamense]MDQ0454650.1 hypothetical protein [Rhizobium paknamense]